MSLALTPQLTSSDLAFPSLLLLVGAGALATAVNTLAGGGSLITFPLLVFLGVPPVAANATNAFALTLGGVSGALGFRRLLPRIGHPLALFAGPARAGAGGGAGLLLPTPERTSPASAPLLLDAATGRRAARGLLRSRLTTPPTDRHGAVLVGTMAIFAVSTYGGYFGAGMGIVFLAVLDLIVPGDLHDHNAIKNWLQCLVNVVAAVIFLAEGSVLVLPGAALMLGGVFGGYASAALSRRLDQAVLRRGVVGYGAVMAGWFLVKAL